MMARLRSFPLPTREEWAAFIDRSLDAIGCFALIAVGIACIAFAQLAEVAP